MGPENQYMPYPGMGGNQMTGYPQQQQQGMMRGRGGYGYDGQQTDRRTMSFQNFANQQNQQPIREESHYLFCKFVDNPDSIMPIDVPTNGDPACFIKSDFSEVYLRAVNSRGTIDNVSYQPVRQQSPEDAQKAKDQRFRDQVFERLSTIENLLSSLIPNTKNQKTPKNVKSAKQEEEVIDVA